MKISMQGKRIAAVVGPTLVVATTSETINLDIWSDNDPTMVYLNGLFLLVAGLVVVTTHFDWRSLASGLVTLAGCLVCIAGATRMYFPEAQQLAPGPVTYAIIAALCAYGIVLCVVAVSRAELPEHT
ncbi:MAG: hypothetical protein NXH88_01710 [Hyphomonas sp.]|nr:hypothetical protein [Hyphomonas sp.]